MSQMRRPTCSPFTFQGSICEHRVGILKQGSAIASIGIHLNDFAAWSVLENVEFSGTHGVLSSLKVQSMPVQISQPAGHYLNGVNGYLYSPGVFDISILSSTSVWRPRATLSLRSLNR